MIRRVTEKELPKTLFKYRSWGNSYHQKLLTERTIYFAKPSEFNDPFDGNIPIRWDLLTYEDCVKKNMEIINIRHKDKDQKAVYEYAKKVTDEKTLWHPDKLAKERPEQLEKWNNIIGLISLSETPSNILMWSHYADNHKGFVVGFDTGKLSTEYDIDYIEAIIYQKSYPLIDGFDDTTTQFYKKFFHKSDLWSYEKEWRLSKNHIENRILKLEKSAITEVILGCMVTEETKSEISSIIREEFGGKVKLSQATKSIDDFRIVIT